MKQQSFYYLLIIACISQLSFSQKTTKVDMNLSNWTIPKESDFEVFDNKETLLLNGKAIIKNHQFSNGTIEVDVYANTARSFAGIVFRKQANTMEEVYMRLHKTNQPDAIQYAPTYNDELTWQLYKEYQAEVSFKNEGWNTLRIEVNTNRADVFVNDEKVLTIDKLRSGQQVGDIGLFSLFNNRFSNFRYTHKDVPTELHSNKKELVPSTIISKWEITEAFPFVEEELNFKEFSKEKYVLVTTEQSGLLPISKYIEKPSSGNFENNEEAYIIALSTIETEKNQWKQFSFDYSDKIIVYLNGQAIFKGNNAFRSKGIQYSGHMDINSNTLMLPLIKGKNTLHCVVIEKANGWGLIGKLE